jgi:hypothetical protein
MASFQDTIRTFIQNKLNDTTNNPLVASGTTFKLYNRYEIEEQDFFDFVVNSVDWEDAPLFIEQFEDYELNDDYDSLAELNAAGASVRVPNVMYQLASGASSLYLYWDNLNKRYFQVDIGSAPYNGYPINEDYSSLTQLEEAGEVYYRYVWWNKDFVNDDDSLGAYVEIDPAQAPYNGYVVNEDFDFLNALISLGTAEQRPLTIYRLLIEEIVWRVGNPDDFRYMFFNEETGSFEYTEAGLNIFSPSTAANNVVINYDGVNYNTTLGQYTLDKVSYIPGIIENFMAEFEPLKFIRNVQYTLPVTFYINETFNRSLDNKIIEAVEVFQDKIRGNIELVYNHNVLFNHTDITPLTGIIDFNGTIFREYQMIIYMDAIKQVLPSNTAYTFFGNQIEYRISVPTLSNGAKFRIYPLTAMAVRSNELHVFQKFSTATNNEFDVKAIPNESGLSLELSFFYTGDSFTKFLYQQKYAQTTLPVVTLEIKYPAQPGDTQIPMEREYLIESIGGAESVGDKIIFTLMLRPVSEVY